MTHRAGDDLAGFGVLEQDAAPVRGREDTKERIEDFRQQYFFIQGSPRGNG